jgi:hypothetical protein
MPDPLYDEINASTKEEIYPSIIEDHFFKGSPWLAYLRNQGVHPFHGGSRMQTAFQFRPSFAGAYHIGDSFNTARVAKISAMNFEPRYYYAAVPEFKETIQVINQGPNAIFDLVAVDMKNAMQTINAILAVSLYREGTTAARSREINGFAEAVNNGTDPNWDGTIATTYGGHTRNGVVSGSLNSTPLWVGTAAGGTGPLMYRHLVSSYDDAVKGADEPNLGLMNKAAHGYVLQRMQPQQRFAQEQDPIWGASCFRFRQALMMVDEYAPSLVYGENHSILGSNLTGSFTTPGSPTSASQLPSSTSVTVGEVFMWINTRTWLFRLTDDEEYGFGWSGFIPSQFDTRVVGYIKAACNVECISPKLNKVIYGIGS